MKEFEVWFEYYEESDWDFSLAESYEYVEAETAEQAIEKVLVEHEGFRQIRKAWVE